MSDTLVTTFKLDAGHYLRGAKSVEKATLDVGRSIDRVSLRRGGFKDLGAGLSQVGGAMNTGVGIAGRFVGALASVEGAVVGASIAASNKAAEYEALTLALEAVEGGAVGAKIALAELRDIAKGPGLGVTEAIETYAGLRRGGLDKALSMELTRQLGNAIAYSGGGREQLGRAGLAISQMAIKPKISGEELMQLNEAGIPASKMITEIFGTADGGELAKKGVMAKDVLKALASEMAKLPRVGSKAKNTIENVFDTIDQKIISFGTGINTQFIPFLQSANDELDKMDGDVFAGMGETIGAQLLSILESATGGTDLPSAIKGVERSVLIVGFAVQNLIENSKSIGEKLADDWNDFLNDIGAGDGNSTEKGINPADLADQLIQAEERMARDKESSSMRGTLDKDGNRLVEVEPGVWVSESDLSPEQRKKAKALKSGKTDVAAPAAEDPKKTQDIAGKSLDKLTSIDQSAKKLVERLDDLAYGGGAITDRTLSQTNLARWTGGRTGGLHQEARDHFIRGFMAMEEASRRLLSDYNRQRHFAPQ